MNNKKGTSTIIDVQHNVNINDVRSTAKHKRGGLQASLGPLRQGSVSLGLMTKF